MLRNIADKRTSGKTSFFKVISASTYVLSKNSIGKKKILNGITTISSDFYQMGKIAAELILNNSNLNVIYFLFFT